MSIWKKTISTATSAALLASILATTVAPAALASVTLTTAGNVAQGTTSAGTATILFTENSAAALNTTGTMTVTILDSAAGATVDWAGTPVVSAPGSLGATASYANNVLTVKVTGQDPANVETISISGLKVKASATAASGAVVATLSAGMIADAFRTGTATATGKLAQAYGPTTTTWIVAVDSGSPCNFGGTNAVTVGAETLAVTSVSANNVPVPGQQTFVTAAMTSNHLANEVVTQTVTNCSPTSLASPATVVRAAAFSYSGTPTVYPGENNGVAGNLTVTEPVLGFFPLNSTLTFTIATAGVVFSQVPTVADDNTAMTTSAAVLSADRKTVVVTVTAASTVAPAIITLSNIRYDVAATVPGGTFVDVNLTPSGALIVTGNPAQNAIVFRGITATASTPTVYIGENNQATGLVTLTELSAGIFNAGTGANNIIAVCAIGVNYTYTFAPWAKVTAGDLRLREGTVASPDNIVVGAQDGMGCYTWTVWSASTAASTIQIGNDTFTTGPLISVGVNQAPGIVAMNIYSGNSATYDEQRIASVGFAVAAFRNQVTVTALSQPTIPAGAVTKAGAIQIAETANGQLKSGEELCFEVMPRGSAGNRQAKYDTLISALNTAQLPIVTASGGLVVSPVVVRNEDCARVNLVPSGQVISFAFNVLQQSTNGTGKLVVDNINLITLADAFGGPVLFNVWGRGGSPTVVQFQAQVSNAKIGAKTAISISSTSALGLMPNQGAWSTSTKVANANKYVTWRFVGGSALAGKTVQIYVAAKNSAGGWGPFVKLTSRLADGSGNAYFHWRTTKQWLSVRAYYPGDTSVAESWSPARQARWK